jgi:hypothetical protein
MEMRVQTMANVVPISITRAPSLLHHNTIRVTYVGTYNFKMEPVRFIPLYFVVMFQSTIIVIETPFVLAPCEQWITI